MSIHSWGACWMIPTLALVLALTGCGKSALGRAENSAPGGRTIGLVLSGFDFMFYHSEAGKEECPEGAIHTNLENWRAQFPTRAARKAHFDRCGGIENRGPDCENVLIAPELVKDPLPYREVMGTKAYGSNLDGTEDGKETAKTCKHQKFQNPDGTKGVDNQLYRLLGCTPVFQAGGRFGPEAAKELNREQVGRFYRYRTLLEIRDVDDERNDEHVEVVIYHGRDDVVADSQGKAVPWQSQRIDEGDPPQYLRGRIVNGVLTTEPADVKSRLVPHLMTHPVLIRGASFQLRLTETGAEGIRTGYVDAESWWRARRISLFTTTFVADSPPAVYSALHRLADGYKDPETGQCTALSSATKIEFVRAYIRHPREEMSDET